jgi:hypothetical protein
MGENGMVEEKSKETELWEPRRLEESRPEAELGHGAQIFTKVQEIRLERRKYGRAKMLEQGDAGDSR